MTATKVRLPAKWKQVKRLPAHAVAITNVQMRGGCTCEQGFQAGRSRYLATGYHGALNWFRIEKSSRLYPPLKSTTGGPTHG